MGSRNFFIKRFIVIYVILFAVGVMAAFYSFNKYIYEQKQKDETRKVAPYRGRLMGEYTCLPHKDTKGPHTLECALGLKTDTGEYYALNFENVDEENQTIPTGKRISVLGTINPVESLEADQMSKYDIEGIMIVSGKVKVLD